jgi:hypothetical protein
MFYALTVEQTWMRVTYIGLRECLALLQITVSWIYLFFLCLILEEQIDIRNVRSTLFPATRYYAFTSYREFVLENILNVWDSASCKWTFLFYLSLNECEIGLCLSSLLLPRDPYSVTNFEDSFPNNCLNS